MTIKVNNKKNYKFILLKQMASHFFSKLHTVGQSHNVFVKIKKKLRLVGVQSNSSHLCSVGSIP